MNNNDLINQAKEFAHRAHDSIGQKRKYTGEPYWVHTDAVALTVEEHGGSDYMIAAAHMHDVLEDVFPELLNQERQPELNKLMIVFLTFPPPVQKLVGELTDQFTSNRYPQWNREKRKLAESERLSKVSNGAKLIKLADLFDNTKSIVQHDPEFAVTYLREKRRILQSLDDVNPDLGLLNKVFNQLENAGAQLESNALQESLNKSLNKSIDKP